MIQRPTLRQLEYAVAVADAGHFGRAAAAVDVSQPGLSGQIRTLEERLGVTLFERSPRGVRCTPAGAEVVARARAALRAVDDLVASAAGLGGAVRGPVRVGVIPTVAPYLLPRVVAAMRTAWPEADLVLHEQRSAALVDDVREGALDLGLLALPYDTTGLASAVIGHESFWLVFPRRHQLDRQGEATLDELRGVPLLLLEEGHCLRDHALAVCELAGHVEHREVRSASLTTLAQMVAAGAGATLLPGSAVAVECRRGTRLKARPLAAPAPGRDIALVWRRSDPRAPQFVELAAGAVVELGMTRAG